MLVYSQRTKIGSKNSLETNKIFMVKDFESQSSDEGALTLEIVYLCSGFDPDESTILTVYAILSLICWAWYG